MCAISINIKRASAKQRKLITNSKTVVNIFLSKILLFYGSLFTFFFLYYCLFFFFIVCSSFGFYQYIFYNIIFFSCASENSICSHE